MGVYKKKSDLVRIIKMKADNTNKEEFWALVFLGT